MDTFEALRHRHMCRSFTGSTLPDRHIERLLYAANRSPAAGNVRTAEIIVIKDPFTIKEIKKVSPGFGGLCPLLMALCTNKTKTQENEVASFDAGAIAENIALASTDLGLGVCFLKSYPDKTIHKILKVPEEKCKIEILLCIGYPAKNRARTRLTAIRIHKEHYTESSPYEEASRLGVRHLDADDFTATNLKKYAKKDELDSSSLFDVALFILASARSTLDESNRYGPKRLIDSLILLLGLPRVSLAESRDPEEEKLLNSIRDDLEKRKDLRSSSMVYTNEFKVLLDSLMERFVVYMEAKRST